MPAAGGIRLAKGPKFSGVDFNANELYFSGTLGTTKYTFDISSCEKTFGLRHGALYEFFYDPELESSFSPATVRSPSGADGNASFSTANLSFNLPARSKLSKDYLGKIFMAIGCLKHHLDSSEEPPLLSAATAAAKAAEKEAAASSVEGHNTGSEENQFPLYLYNIDDQSLICLTDCVTEAHLYKLYSLRPCAPETKPFDTSVIDIPFEFKTSILPTKYFVREREHVYLANLQDTATIIGEQFGCLWVQLGSSGKIVPLPKATDESRLVTLYGLSDIENAPTVGQTQLQPISPRQIQTPRATSGSGQQQAPFVLNKRTADHKPAVLCNCPMGQTVLAVNTHDALSVFGVKPMGRIYFTLGVDAGKSATILGVRNGNLYIHVDGDKKCTCLRNATNAEELREKYTGDASSVKSGGNVAPSPSATIPKDLPRQTSSSAAAQQQQQQETSSPTNVPRLALNRVGSGGVSSPSKPSSPAGEERLRPFASMSPQSHTSPAAAPRGFYYWTANGCLLFDVSSETCKQFGLRHGQVVRFAAGVDAGGVFHIVGVRHGTVYVVPDRQEFAVPLRHCPNAEEVQNRVAPVLLTNGRLRSADPRGPAPMAREFRSPDRRAGSPFGISPRNTRPEDEEDEKAQFYKQDPSGASPTRQYGQTEISALSTASRSMAFDMNVNAAASGNYAASGVFMQEGSGGNLLRPSVSISPAGQHHSTDAASSLRRAQMQQQSSSLSPSSGGIGVGATTKSSVMISPSAANNNNSRSTSNAAAVDRDIQFSPSAVSATRIQPPGPVSTEAFKVGNMPATRVYLKAIALRAFGMKREADMPTAFFRFFAHDAGGNLSRALKEMPKFITYWDSKEKPMRGGRGFAEATSDMMVEALENLAQLRGSSF